MSNVTAPFTHSFKSTSIFDGVTTVSRELNRSVPSGKRLEHKYQHLFHVIGRKRLTRVRITCQGYLIRFSSSDQLPKISMRIVDEYVEDESIWERVHMGYPMLVDPKKLPTTPLDQRRFGQLVAVGCDDLDLTWDVNSPETVYENLFKEHEVELINVVLSMCGHK